MKIEEMKAEYPEPDFIEDIGDFFSLFWGEILFLLATRFTEMLYLIAGR